MLCEVVSFVNHEYSPSHIHYDEYIGGVFDRDIYFVLLCVSWLNYIILILTICSFLVNIKMVE